MFDIFSNPEFSEALAALSGVVIAFFAFLLSIISLVVSIRALRIQRRHNVLSVVPIPIISLHDYENSIKVLLRNNGSGPLRIIRFRAAKNTVSETSVIEWMPNLPNGRTWTDFIEDIDGRTILPGSYLTLLELTSSKEELKFNVARDFTRKNLLDLECTVTYTDVYDTVFPEYSRGLGWFGRNL